ncbi:Fur family transcriptional regulator [Nonomuraea aridisoli]|uniref:Transcriptional repressor n=1 Tax=Nonomuraea aridisoli TaxID=2070368 RepID=A0A2W2F5T4_9ACTN|nr:Fur family transcriptional regulator [Nonomuraea aridisoli]PZG21020.1 transcriptional repressor [Nonomuraea aridisoli]
MVDMARWGPMLETAGIRVTSQRLLVLEVLAAHRLPVSARRVHAELQDRGATTGLTTVYRALASMTEAGLVHAFTHMGEGVYRLCGSASHHHLVCRVCGMVAERQEDIVDGFRAEEVYGVCATCESAESGSRRCSTTTGATADPPEVTESR